ncbi:MAG: hypothetical protein H0U77_14075 [Nocardioidaceae bacterium]|nr:hypothetical protein [Nocardioidaceae bacterium]
MTPFPKFATGLACGLLLASTLAACGGSDSGEDSPASGEDYCGALEDANAQFQSLEEDDSSQLGEAFATMQSLGENPPKEVAADWEVVTTGLADFEQALEDAGLSAEDLGDLANLDPAELDPEALQEITEAGQELDSPEFTAAFESIEKHAESECDVTLGDETQ